MPLRYYIVPNSRDFIPAPDGDGTVGTWELRSKYFKDLAMIKPSRRRFGDEGYDLVACDLSSLDHDYVANNADVIAIPENLDATPGAGARNQAVTALEERNIPAGWIQAGMTWRQILRTVARIMILTKDLAGGLEAIGKLFQNGRTPNTQFQDLPEGVRNKLLAFAARRGFDSSSLTGASTLRQILKAMADQTPIPNLRGVEI